MWRSTHQPQASCVAAILSLSRLFWSSSLSMRRPCFQNEVPMPNMTPKTATTTTPHQNLCMGAMMAASQALSTDEVDEVEELRLLWQT